MAEAVSGYFGIDFTTYINNDTLGRMKELITFLGADEEESKKAFYGKGAVGAIGLVPISDIVEIHNLGVAAGYWNMLADEESTAGWLMGLREYKSIDNSEFAKEAAVMLSIEMYRLVNNTLPARNYNNPFWSMIRAELGLYPGTTAFGIDTRAMRKKFVPNKTSEPGIDYSNTPYQGLTKKRRDKAIESLSFFRK